MKNQKYITMTLQEYEEREKKLKILEDIDYIMEGCYSNDDYKQNNNGISLTYEFSEENVKLFLKKYINEFKIQNDDVATRIEFVRK